jgi:hypothetical protein
MVKTKRIKGGKLTWMDWLSGKKDYCEASTVTTETAKANKLIKDGNDTKKKGDDLLDTIKSEQEKCKTSTTAQTSAQTTAQTTAQTSDETSETSDASQHSNSEMDSHDLYRAYSHPTTNNTTGENPMYKMTGGRKRSRRYKRHRRKSKRKSHRRYRR